MLIILGTNSDFCKNNDLYIVNSRLGSDKNIGEVTCRNRSTVDYVIAIVNILNVLQDFEIHDFCTMLSDVHRPISFTISCSTEQHKSKYENESQLRVKLCSCDNVAVSNLKKK